MKKRATTRRPVACREQVISPVSLQIVETTLEDGTVSYQARAAVSEADLFIANIGKPQKSYLDAFGQITKAF